MNKLSLAPLTIACALLGGTAVIAVPLAPAIAATEATAKNPASAQEFVTKASIANMFEIETSKLALEKAENEAVRTFAQHMIDDHGAAGKKMKEETEAAQEKVTPATQLDEAHQSKLNKLKAVSGAEFDTRYVAIQKDAHKEAVALFTHYAETGDDPALKAFASDTLPTLREHDEEISGLKIPQLAR